MNLTRHPGESRDPGTGGRGRTSRDPAFAGSEEEGFTLVELMVVIVIIGLLATIVMINVMPAADRAAMTKARADIATLEQGIEMYRLDHLRYPTSERGAAGAGHRRLYPPPARRSVGQSLSLQRAGTGRAPVPDRLAGRRRPRRRLGRK